VALLPMVKVPVCILTLKRLHSFLEPPRACQTPLFLGPLLDISLFGLGKSTMSTRTEEDADVQVASQGIAEQETTPLLTGRRDDLETQRTDSISENQYDEEPPARSVFGIISVLLIGVFVSQADTTLVFATYAHITSEFIRMGDGSWIDGSWIVTSFGLATCATQPMYGRLSQIFGRKPILQMSYLLFLIGTAVAGLAQNMVQMIIGRVIQGAGSAGMVSMVSILLTGMTFPS
jgi:hypothetical protein